MSEPLRTETPQLSVSQPIDVALIGNPNAGKTTVFNALTGLRQKVGNYPGVTVEKKTGFMNAPGGLQLHVHDLPGMYSLVPSSIDEQIAADVVIGRARSAGNLRLIVVVADASNLSRNLYLVTQAVELDVPVLLALNMFDTAEANGLKIDVRRLSQELGIPVVPVVANKGTGIPELRKKIIEISAGKNGRGTRKGIELDGRLKSALAPVSAWLVQNAKLSEPASWHEAARILSSNKALESWYHGNNGRPLPNQSELRALVAQARESLAAQKTPWHALEPRLRYAWIDRICSAVVLETKKTEVSLSEKVDRVLTHRVAGPLVFVLIFAFIFQTIFSWAEVPMEAIENLVLWTGQQVAALMPNGVLEDLIVDGVIAGVGAILVFLPQILFLFFFLSLLEATGYMARVAFIMDRFMRSAGLSGRSVIPLLSSFACAIPGIMATRTIDNTRDRIVTIMIAPLMSCSARLPVYALMIGAFIPAVTVFGVFSLKGLTLLAMYLLGILAALAAAQVIKRFVGRTQKPSTFIMELPPYRMPSLRWTLLQMWERAKIFVTDAGKIILAMSIVLWFLASYPKPDNPETVDAGQAIRQSYAGQLGRAIEPVIKPLGFDWKMGIGLITSFAAREVLVSTLATIYNVEGADETSVTLRQKLKSELDPETGKPVYTPLVALSLMVFFVLACQCMSTVAIAKRETNSWRWPVTMVVYMTLMAYVASWLVYQFGTFIGLS
ncbi:MAG: ferrous iron transport protein B [bacterium]